MGIDPVTGVLAATVLSGGFGILGSKAKKKAGTKASAAFEQSSLRAIDLLETAKTEALELTGEFRTAALEAFQGLLGLAVPELPDAPKLAELPGFKPVPFTATKQFDAQKKEIQRAVRGARAARGTFFSGLAEQEEIEAVGELIARTASSQEATQARNFQIQLATTQAQNQNRLAQFELEKNELLQPLQLQSGLLGNILNLAFPSISNAQNLITGTAQTQAGALTGIGGIAAQTQLQAGQAQAGLFGDISQTITGAPLTFELLKSLQGNQTQVAPQATPSVLSGQLGLPLDPAQQFPGFPFPNSQIPNQPLVRVA